MKNLVLALLFTTACFATDPSSVAPSAAGPSTAVMDSPTTTAGSTSIMPSQSTSLVASDSPSHSVMSSSQSPSASPSMSPSVSPSHSMSPSASPSHSMASSSSASPSMSISPSASSSATPASSSRVPTTNPPTTNPTTTAPKQQYNVDVQVKDEHSGKPCLWFKASINVTYSTKNESGHISLMGKDVTKIAGTCSDLTKVNETSEVTLTFENEKITSMTAQFKAGSSSWFFSKIGVVLNVPVSVNGQVIAEKTFEGDQETEYLHASTNKSYSCALKDDVKLEAEQNANVTVSIIDIMVQPFTHNNTMVDSKENDSCSSKSKTSKSSSIVPIAVGCALAGLIVIVLIAYLIGRRKNDGRGYQQV